MSIVPSVWEILPSASISQTSGKHFPTVTSTDLNTSHYLCTIATIIIII